MIEDGTLQPMASPWLWGAALLGGGLLWAARKSQPQRPRIVQRGTGVVLTPKGPTIEVEWDILKQNDGSFSWRFFTPLTGFWGLVESEGTFPTPDAALTDLVEKHTLVPTTGAATVG